MSFQAVHAHAPALTANRWRPIPQSFFFLYFTFFRLVTHSHIIELTCAALICSAQLCSAQLSPVGSIWIWMLQTFSCWILSCFQLLISRSVSVRSNFPLFTMCGELLFEVRCFDVAEFSAADVRGVACHSLTASAGSIWWGFANTAFLLGFAEVNLVTVPELYPVLLSFNAALLCSCSCSSAHLTSTFLRFSIHRQFLTLIETLLHLTANLFSSFFSLFFLVFPLFSHSIWNIAVHVHVLTLAAAMHPHFAHHTHCNVL